MKKTGAEIVLECLKEQNVKKIFGYPGGAVIPLYDALYDYKKDFDHILTAHEQGATHAADGYARSTGEIGVCFATSGPGATNTITGIATAYMDSVPLVVITGQVPSTLLGKDSFQEVDITGMTLSVTKQNYFIKRIEDLADTIRKAFEIAGSGRKGPVLIDIPKDIFTQTGNYEKKDIESIQEDEEEIIDLIKIANMINESDRPVIYAGGGVISSSAPSELYDFATKGNIPVVNTLMGLSSFPRDHYLSLGLVGMHGLKEANLTVSNSDLVIAVGARFSDRVIGKAEAFAKNAKVLHIDIDRSEIGKNKDTDIWIQGDVKKILHQLSQMLIEKPRSEWLRKIEEFKMRDMNKGKEFHAKNILKCAAQILGEDSIVVTEVGQHQMWTAQHFPFKEPRTFLSSGGLGTMGYGLGAAIGAQVGNPKRNVLHIAGDGSFRMNCNELATVSKYKLPIITLIFNNSALGMVRQWQKMFCNERYSQTDITPDIDYVKLAQAYFIQGKQVKTIAGLHEALEEAKQCKKPTIIECILSKDDDVFPMVPPLAPIDQMIFD